LKLITLIGTSLNTTVYRGYAKARDLAKISEPDIFDQDKNPLGTQRELKPWHARDAHAYAAGNIERETTYRLWPEVILNVRDKKVAKVGRPNANNLVTIEVFEHKIRKQGGISPQISRVDGNHRLFWAEGLVSRGKVKLEPLDEFLPFCMTIGLSTKEEAALFRDINATQVKMNTSHLDHLSYRLKGEEIVKREETALWIAEELATDEDSPFSGKIYLGGRKTKGSVYLLSLRTFKEGISVALRESQELGSEEIPYQSKYKAIRNFWRAVRNTFLTEWNDPKSHLLLSYFAYFAWSKMAALVIDRCVRKENPTIDEMQNQLLGIKRNVDWRNEGTFKGFGGKGGGDKAFEMMKRYLPKEYKVEAVIKKL